MADFDWAGATFAAAPLAADTFGLVVSKHPHFDSMIGF